MAKGEENTKYSRAYTPSHSSLCGTAALLVLIVLAGCGRDYTSRMSGVLEALERNDPDTALHEMDELIARGEEGKKPESKNLGLLHLERGSIYQSQTRFREATSDFTHADQITELLDLTPQGARNAAEYLFNDSAKLYHAPLYEKLLINISALSSFLALGDVQSAMVEARRIAVLGEYYETAGYEEHPLLGVAWYLSGLAMEVGNRGRDASFFYRKATATFPGPEAQQALDGLGSRQSELVSITLTGTGPQKQPQRLPIGLLLGWINDSPDFSIGPSETEVLGGVSIEEALTWVNFPTMEPADYGFKRLALNVGGQQIPLTPTADIAGFAIGQWLEDRPAIAWSAVTRAITRVAVRETMQVAGEVAGQSNGVLGAIFQLGGLAAQAGMQAADIPDTRAWNLMPAAIYIERVTVAPGQHRVRLSGDGAAGGIAVDYDVNVPEEGIGVIVSRMFHPQQPVYVAPPAE